MSFAQHGSAASTPAQQSKPESVAAPAAGESSVSGGYAYDPEVLRNLIVNYLPPLMNEAQVYELFGQFGRIESVKIIYDKITGESRGYGFVKYQFFFSATYAVFYLNRFEIGGKKLKVAYANAPAAKEAYDMLRSSAVALNMQQQHAMQSMYYHQMVLAQEQNGAPVASSLATSAPMGGGDDYGLYMNSVGGSYAMRQHDNGAGYAQGMHPGMVAGGSVYLAGPSTSGSRIITPAMAPIRF